MFDRILSRGKIRAAAKRLSGDPSAKNYLLLAQAHATLGQTAEVYKVCEEGLAAHPSDAELQRLRDRVETLNREQRVRELQQLIQAGPRTALWRELCEIQLKAGLVSRAEEVASEWFSTTGDSNALFYQAKARAERYFTDRRRDDARRALQLTAQCQELDPGDARPTKLRLAIFTRCGAWNEARTCIARLLEMFPGEPSLEARFRVAVASSENSRSLDSALREVERTGQFVDDDCEAEPQSSTQSVRPVLQSIASEPGVHGAFYVRGGTALVQGPKGATAERQARGVRELVTSSRAAARRLGLGQPQEISFEGDFGALNIRPGSVGAAALWTARQPSRKHLEALGKLSRFESQAPEVEA